MRKLYTLLFLVMLCTLSFAAGKVERKMRAPRRTEIAQSLRMNDMSATLSSKAAMMQKTLSPLPAEALSKAPARKLFSIKANLPAANDKITATVKEVKDLEVTFDVTPSNVNETWAQIVYTKQQYDELVAKAPADSLDFYINSAITEQIDYVLYLSKIYYLFGLEDELLTFADLAYTGATDLTVGALTPETDYVALFTYMACDESGQENVYTTNNKPAVVPFKTKELKMSENVINVTIDKEKGIVRMEPTIKDEEYGMFIFKTDAMPALMEEVECNTPEALYAYYVAHFANTNIFEGDTTLYLSEEMEYYYRGDGNYTLMYSPFVSAPAICTGPVKSLDFDFTAPKATCTTLKLENAEGAYYGTTDGLNDYNLLFYKDFNEQTGELYPPYVVLNVFTEKINSFTGTYSMGLGTIYPDYSNIVLEDAEYGLADAKLTLTFTGKKNVMHMAEYAVDGLIILDNMAGDSLRLTGSTWIYAYDKNTESNIPLEEEIASKSLKLSVTDGVALYYKADDNFYVTLYNPDTEDPTYAQYPYLRVDLYGCNGGESLNGTYDLMDGSLGDYYSEFKSESGSTGFKQGWVKFEYAGERQDSACYYNVEGYFVMANVSSDTLTLGPCKVFFGAVQDADTRVPMLLEPDSYTSGIESLATDQRRRGTYDMNGRRVGVATRRGLYIVSDEQGTRKVLQK